MTHLESVGFDESADACDGGGGSGGGGEEWDGGGGGGYFVVLFLLSKLNGFVDWVEAVNLLSWPRHHTNLESIR